MVGTSVSTEGVRAAPAGVRALRRDGDTAILESVALALNSTLELSEVLRVLAGITLEATGADRCSVLLLEGRRLVPTAAIGRVSNEDLWTAFRAMGDIDLVDLPGAWELLSQPKPIPVVDAAASRLIPRSWLERFTLRSLVVVPLLVADEPCGVMVADHQVTQEFSDAQLRLLEAVGSYAAVAVRNARNYEAMRRRSQVQEALATAAMQLVSPLPQHEIAHRLLDACLAVVPAARCAIGLLDAENTKVETIATRGMRHIPTPLPVADVPPELIARLQARWDSAASIDIGDVPGVRALLGHSGSDLSYVIVPLRAEEHLRGGILLGIRKGVRLQQQERTALSTLATIASASFERGLLLKNLKQQVRHMQALHDLGDALSGRLDASSLVERLNGLLGKEPFSVSRICFRDGSLAELMGGSAPTPDDKKAWMKGDILENEEGEVFVPMRLGRRVVGTMSLRDADLGPSERSFVSALAQGAAEVSSRASLRAEVELAERERALSAERGRIAAELHDTAGQTFVAIGLLARRASDQLPGDSPWRDRIKHLAELADAGRWDINRAVQSLAFFPEGREGIVPSLEALVRSFEEDSGLPIVLDCSGPAVQLPAGTERALYLVAHSSLTTAWRHARSSVIRIEIKFDEANVTMMIADDGLGVSRRNLNDSSRLGVASMRNAITEVGGTLRVTSRRPQGTLVTAMVPAEQT